MTSANYGRKGLTDESQHLQNMEILNATISLYIRRLGSVLECRPEEDLDPRIEHDVAASLRKTADLMESRARRRIGAANAPAMALVRPASA